MSVKNSRYHDFLIAKYEAICYYYAIKVCTLGGYAMAISYNLMKKRMIDLDMKPKDLKNLAGISQNILAKINKNEPISLDSLEKICEALECNIADVMEFVPSSTSNQNYRSTIRSEMR